MKDIKEKPDVSKPKNNDAVKIYKVEFKSLLNDFETSFEEFMTGVMQ